MSVNVTELETYLTWPPWRDRSSFHIPPLCPGWSHGTLVSLAPGSASIARVSGEQFLPLLQKDGTVGSVPRRPPSWVTTCRRGRRRYRKPLETGCPYGQLLKTDWFSPTMARTGTSHGLRIRSAWTAYGPESPGSALQVKKTQGQDQVLASGFVAWTHIHDFYISTKYFKNEHRCPWGPA